MAEQITIDIGPTGETKITVDGVAGTSCKDLTRSIEKALGKTTVDKKTGDFYKATDVEQNRVQQG